MRRLLIIIFFFPLFAQGQVAYRSGFGIGLHAGSGIWGTSIPQFLPTEKVGYFQNLGLHFPMGNYGYIGIERQFYGNSFINDTNSLKPFSQFSRWSIPLVGMIPLNTKIPIYFTQTGRPRLFLEVCPTIGGEFIYDPQRSFANVGENPWNNSLIFGLTFHGARPAYHNRSMEDHEFNLSFLVRRVRNSDFVSPKAPDYSVFSIFTIQASYSLFQRFQGGKM
jgi:hypothetical protein